MAFDYDRIAASALRQIENAGLDVTITRTVVGSFDPTTGGTTAAADIVATASGVQTRYSNRDIDGTVIKRGDMRLLIAASGLSISPEQGDTATSDSIVWQVVNVESIKPSDTAVLYICQVRK